MLDHLRTAHPHVTVEGCAGGGGRVEHATIARTDVVWPSDKTAPMDRLAHPVRLPPRARPAHHELLGHRRPRPLRPAAALARLPVRQLDGGRAGHRRRHPPLDTRRAEAARWIARYKEIRDVVHHGEVHLLGSPADPTCGVQYAEAGGDRLVVTAWNTGPLDGAPLVPGRPARLRLRGLRPDAVYADTATGTRYSGAYLLHSGLPYAWTAQYDAELTVLARQ